MMPTTPADRSGLVIESDGGVVRLTLDRPERRNALSRALIGNLEEALAAIEADPVARVVVIEPEILVLDEPTSALDVSVQKQVLALLASLQQRHGMSYLFISHDLSVIRAVAHRILVMKDGVVVEQGETQALLQRPQMPYTQVLLQAVSYAGELEEN